MLPSGLPERVDDDEWLARLLTSSDYFNSVGVKASALMPNPQNGETSVFRQAPSPCAALWELGRVLAAGGRTLHGVASFKAAHVRQALLEVTASEPPPKHANIVGWSGESDPKMAKAHHKECALAIAQHAMVVCIPL
jgi:hypothetical protein